MSIAPKTQYEHRAGALQILYTYESSTDVPLEEIVLNYTQEEGLVLSDESFCLKLVRGVLEQRNFLDSEIAPLSNNWKIERIELTTKIIIRMALWEIIFFKSPVKVVIDQALDLSKDFCDKDSYRFVNGILDHFIKQKKNQ